MAQALVRIKNLKKHFSLGKTIVKAVDDVSLDINPGETLGLVGESGCGKSTLARMILRLCPANSGEVYFEDECLFNLSSDKMKAMRRKMQMIFQDPYASLNPRMTVNDIIGEALDIHHLASGQARTERIYELLILVGLRAEHLNRFPHEFSGGQRQRIGIARTLAVDPQFIICDEPISALDVSIQAQIINLLKELQNKLGLAYLFITHNLSMLEYISDRIAVMYKGSLVELADSQELYLNPLHPYTKSLLSAIPIPNPTLERKRIRMPYVDRSEKNAEKKWCEVEKDHFVMY